MVLSKNFKLDEFTSSGSITIVPTDQQIYCLLILCTFVLQPIRTQFGSVKITSGLRNKEVYDKLIKQGYPASKTSDHFAWCDINPIGTGAADFYCPKADTKTIFDWIIKNISHQCRQIIYYPDMNVIHVSNHFNSIFKMSDKMPLANKYLIKTKDKGFEPYKI